MLPGKRDGSAKTPTLCTNPLPSNPNNPDYPLVKRCSPKAAAAALRRRALNSKLHATGLSTSFPAEATPHPAHFVPQTDTHLGEALLPLSCRIHTTSCCLHQKHSCSNNPLPLPPADPPPSTPTLVKRCSPGAAGAALARPTSRKLLLTPCTLQVTWWGSF
jgi:hypothetical protein